MLQSNVNVKTRRYSTGIYIISSETKLAAMLRSLSFAGAALLVNAAALAQDVQPVADTIAQQQLKEVKIRSQRNAIETAPGKTIINVQSLAGASGKNALELMRRLPGVTVDGQGNISITGKQGVLVMVNGRQTYLSGEELRDYLEGIMADEVAQIEVISQPSAMYDAEGNAGIINLKLRKTRRKGLSGNANMAWTKSLYESTHNTALINYNAGKNNWYTNLSYINGRNGVSWRQDMVFKDAAGIPEAYSVMTSEPRELFDKYKITSGVDRNCTENTNMGFNVSGAYYANQMNSPIVTQTIFTNGNTENSTRYTNENSLRHIYTANAYLRHTFSKQADLNINVDYLHFGKNLYQYLETEAFSNGVAQPDPLTLKSRVPISINTCSPKADYVYALTDDLKLETGGKYSHVAVDNAAYYSRYAQGAWADDNSRTNRFLYNEQISALYINGVKKLNEQWDIQTGLRAEYAYITGLQTATGAQFTRRLPALFPTAYISYKPDSFNSFEINYGRRIERPQYGMLNPFNYYTFYNTYQRGNPALLPQYGHNAELKHSYKNHITTQATFNRTTNAITHISLPDNATQTTYGIPVNFASNSTATIGITYNGKPAQWCELTVHSAAVYALYKGIINNVPLQKAKAGYNVWLNSRLILGSGWSADCYSSCQSAMVASPVSTSIPTLYTNFGISKKLFHDTTTVKVAVDDPFYVYRSGNDDEQPGLTNTARLLSNSRYCTMSVTYNFGQNTNRARRQHNEAEEIRRL